jgi:hypothetical protein
MDDGKAQTNIFEQNISYFKLLSFSALYVV